MEFKAGDLVTIVRKVSGAGKVNWATPEMDATIGSWGVVSTGIKGGFGQIGVRVGDQEWWYMPESLCLLNGEKNKMKTLRQRIEALNNGWDKEAESILLEMGDGHNITISQDLMSKYQNYYPYGTITVKSLHGKEKCFGWGDIKESKPCAKNVAFKQALVWLLEESGLDTPQVGQEVKAEIEGKIYKVKIIEKVG